MSVPHDLDEIDDGPIIEEIARRNREAERRAELRERIKALVAPRSLRVHLQGPSRRARSCHPSTECNAERSVRVSGG
jgi:hypothetical protein